MENRNSVDYMDMGETVKARRRRIFCSNILLHHENTPLFPTGELIEYVGSRGVIEPFDVGQMP